MLDECKRFGSKISAGSHSSIEELDLTVHYPQTSPRLPVASGGNMLKAAACKMLLAQPAAPALPTLCSMVAGSDADRLVTCKAVLVPVTLPRPILLLPALTQVCPANCSAITAVLKLCTKVASLERT